MVPEKLDLLDRYNGNLEVAEPSNRHILSSWLYRVVADRKRPETTTR